MSWPIFKGGNLQLMLRIQNRRKAPKNFFAPPPKKKKFFLGRCSKMLCANLLKEPAH